jgi:hypothetical protein
MSSLSILNRATKGDIERSPFPHLVLPEALDPSLYAALASQFPSVEQLADGRSMRNRKRGLNGLELLAKDFLSPLWKEFVAYHTSQAFYDQFYGLFDDEIAHLYPDLKTADGRPPSGFRTKPRSLKERRLAHRDDDFVLDCQIMVDDTSDPRVCRGPHVDDPAELFAALLYFRHPDDRSDGGELYLARSTNDAAVFPSLNVVRAVHEPAEVDEAHTEIVKRIPYGPNVAVIFLNSFRSLHAVSMRAATDVARRHVNIIGESYSRPGGLFRIEKATNTGAGSSWDLARIGKRLRDLVAR